MIPLNPVGRNGKALITDEQIKKAKRVFSSGASIREAARSSNMSYSKAWKIVTGRSFRAEKENSQEFFVHDDYYKW